jgi:hypothetical protein
MARGNSSRASSERGDNPFNAGSPQKTEGQYRAELISHFKDLVKEGMGPTGLKNIPDPDLKVIAANVDNASSDVRDQRDEFDRTVEAAKKALDAGIIDFGSYSQASEVLPLTFSEVQNGDDPFDIINDAVEEERPDDIEEFVRDFIQARVDSASADRDDYDDEINTIEADELEDQVSSWEEEINRDEQS